ncbi:hypothetical protein APHAL10511_004940 [Amanita phalloides]|nr:hypothetical protein APHAL10511_004940 [Amanita phalloides]
MIQGKLLAANDIQKAHQSQLSELQAAIELEKSTRVETVGRITSLKKLENLEEEMRDFKKELNTYADCDPAIFEQTKRATFLAKEAAIRWTDNYATLLGYFTRQKGVDGSDVRKYLGIEEDYEDIC